MNRQLLHLLVSKDSLEKIETEHGDGCAGWGHGPDLQISESSGTRFMYTEGPFNIYSRPFNI